MIFLEPLVERDRHRCAVEGHQHRALLLMALIGLDRGRHLVLVVDLVDLDLVALDATAGIDQVVIIVHCRAQHDAGDLRRAGAVALHPNHHFLLLCRRGPGERHQHRARQQRQHAA